VSTRDAFLTAQGGGVGLGCWVRSDTINIHIDWFGTVEGVAVDNTSAIQKALDHVKLNGLHLTAGAGTFLTKSLSTGGGTLQWSLIAAGKRETIFKHADGDGTLFSGAASSVGYTLKGFTIDAQHSVHANAGARNCVAAVDTSNVTLEDLFLTDYKLSAALVFSSVPANKFINGKIINCEVDGLSVGVNGFLFADMDFCTYERCEAKNVVFSIDGPGVGIQFKNNCKHGSAVDIYAENCNVGVGLAGDTGGLTPGPSGNTLTNIRSDACTTGLLIGNGSEFNALSNVSIDHNNENSSDPIDIQGTSISNSITNVNIINIGSSRRAVFFRTDSTDNYVELASLTNMNTSGIPVVFDTTALRNRVSLRRQANPVLNSSGMSSMAGFTDNLADGNSFTYDDYIAEEEPIVATGVITLKNAATESVLIDTEGSAATDDLDTIISYEQTGKEIRLQTVNDGRDVVIKHNTGNIRLVGSADLTLGTRRSYVTLVFNQFSGAWFEISRSIHP
jgi:hypothetical protein